MRLRPLYTHTQIQKQAHILPRKQDNRLKGTTLYKICSGIPSFTKTIIPQINTRLIYPEKNKMRRPLKNTLMDNGMRCGTQNPSCNHNITIQMTPLHLFPVKISDQRSQRSSIITATCSKKPSFFVMLTKYSQK